MSLSCASLFFAIFFHKNLGTAFGLFGQEHTPPLGGSLGDLSMVLGAGISLE